MGDRTPSPRAALPLLIVHMITLLLRVALLTRRLAAHLEGPSLPAPAATAVFLWRHVQRRELPAVAVREKLAGLLVPPLGAAFR